MKTGPSHGHSAVGPKDQDSSVISQTGSRPKPLAVQRGINFKGGPSERKPIWRKHVSRMECHACLGGKQVRIAEHQCAESEELRRQLTASTMSATSGSKKREHKVFASMPTWCASYRAAPSRHSKAQILEEARLHSFVATIGQIHDKGSIDRDWS